MSFTLDVKNELVNINIQNTCCRQALFAGIISFGGSIGKEDYTFSTENISVAELVADMASTLFDLKTQIEVKGNVYAVRVKKITSVLDLLGMTREGEVGFHIPQKMTGDCCLRAYARGAFLGGGSVISPQKRYHLEFVTSHYAVSREFADIFKRFDIPSKTLMRKSRYVTYFKDNEIICDVLALIGAGSAVMEISNTNIEKSLNNIRNRQINCETANMDKTINASVRQVLAIEKIKTAVGLDSLPKQLAELAELRLEHKDLSLGEIAGMLSPPISKSGVNHRMRKIISIAEGVKTGE